MGFAAMPHESAEYCREQVRRYDRERYLCAVTAAEPARGRLMALYAFNLEASKVRETVSEAVLGQIRLQWWRDALEEFGRGVVRAHPVSQALSEALRDSPVRPALLERLLTAREFDLDDDPPQTLTALEEYAAGTSASLQQAALGILGVADEAAERAAASVGTAWALIGLLRAVPFHARQRRLYLPAELLEKERVSHDALFEGRPGAGLKAVVRALDARAGEHLSAARALRREVPREALPALLPAVLADIHRRRLAAVDYDPFAPALQRPLPFDALRLGMASWRGRY